MGDVSVGQLWVDEDGITWRVESLQDDIDGEEAVLRRVDMPHVRWTKLTAHMPGYWELVES